MTNDQVIIDLYRIINTHCITAAEEEDALREAIRVLESQRPAKPFSKCDMCFCGNCRYAIAATMNYCPKCGKGVKWNEQ